MACQNNLKLRAISFSNAKLLIIHKLVNKVVKIACSLVANGRDHYIAKIRWNRQGNS